MSKNEGFILRALDQLSFGISAFLASFFIKNNYIIIGTSPQFFTVISCSIISFFKRIPWVFELRDLWPDSIMALGFMKKSDISYKILKKIEIFLYKNCLCIIPVTKSFKDYLEKMNIDKNKIKVITNGINFDLISPIKKNEHLIKSYNLKNKLILGYIGTHGLAQGLKSILNTIKNLNKDGYEDKLFFFFIGEGSEKRKLISFKNMHKLSNVIFLDSLDRNILKNYWSILDISLIHLKKIDLFKEVIPSKIFESMGMNVPILLGVDGESREIVEEYKIGEYFEPENEIELYKLITKFHNKRHHLKLYKENAKLHSHIFDRSLLSDKMISFIQQKL